MANPSTETAQIKSILYDAFKDNKSVIWAVNSKKKSKIEVLLDYSIGMAYRYGRCFSDINSAYAYLKPYEKKFSSFELTASVKLILAIGIAQALKLSKREKYIHSYHPEEPYIYLWYIGVRKIQQGKGLGSHLLEAIKQSAKQEGLPIYLETSAQSNISFYEKAGFENYHTWNSELMGFPLYFFRWIPS